MKTNREERKNVIKVGEIREEANETANYQNRIDEFGG